MLKRQTLFVGLVHSGKNEMELMAKPDCPQDPKESKEGSPGRVVRLSRQENSAECSL
jgi:hypothetical protein